MQINLPLKRASHLFLTLFLPLLMACSQSDDSTPKTTKTDTDSTPAAFEYTADALAGLDNYMINCGKNAIDLQAPVYEIATAISDSNFLYATKPLTDCSGIFHRVLNKMKSTCPENSFPDISKYRDSRDLARWYHEQGKLILIDDVFKHSKLIKPGAVLFYGQRAVEYKNFTAEELFQRGTGINHLGIVVGVHKDENGDISQYELFHGHGRPGKITVNSKEGEGTIYTIFIPAVNKKSKS